MLIQGECQHASLANERRDLEIEIRFLEGIVRRAPAFIEALQLLGDNYARLNDFNASLQVDRRLAELCPDDPIAHYNLACSASLCGEIALGLSSLKDCLECGYDDYGFLIEDPDLRELRRSPEFFTIIEVLATNSESSTESRESTQW